VSLVDCKSCGEWKPLQARGLCGRCYEAHRQAGTLDQFPRRYKPRTPNEATPVERTSPAGVRYRYVWDPDHPTAHADGYCPEHRRVAWEAGLLTEATRRQVVQHLNGDGLDNRPENLWVGTIKELACRGGTGNQWGPTTCRSEVCDYCDRPTKTGRLCALHRGRYRTTGDPLGVLAVKANTEHPYNLRTGKRPAGGIYEGARPLHVCVVEGCGAASVCRGWCQMHYARFKSTGDPLGVKRVFALTQAPYRLYEAGVLRSNP
jgi:hypothetical protein